MCSVRVCERTKGLLYECMYVFFWLPLGNVRRHCMAGHKSIGESNRPEKPNTGSVRRETVSICRTPKEHSPREKHSPKRLLTRPTQHHRRTHCQGLFVTRKPDCASQRTEDQKHRGWTPQEEPPLLADHPLLARALKTRADHRRLKKAAPTRCMYVIAKARAAPRGSDQRSSNVTKLSHNYGCPRQEDYVEARPGRSPRSVPTAVQW